MQRVEERAPGGFDDLEKVLPLTEREGKRHRVDLLQNVATRPLGRLGRAFYVRLREFETRLRKDGPN